MWLCSEVPVRFVVDRRLARLVQDETLVEIDVSCIAEGWEVRDSMISLISMNILHDGIWIEVLE